jgi:hypothetical protein
MVAGGRAYGSAVVVTGPVTVRTHAALLLDRPQKLLAAVDSCEVPGGQAYRHRVKGGITALFDGAGPAADVPRGRAKGC